MLAHYPKKKEKKKINEKEIGELKSTVEKITK